MKFDKECFFYKGELLKYPSQMLYGWCTKPSTGKQFFTLMLRIKTNQLGGHISIRIHSIVTENSFIFSTIMYFSLHQFLCESIYFMTGGIFSHFSCVLLELNKYVPWTTNTRLRWHAAISRNVPKLLVVKVCFCWLLRANQVGFPKPRAHILPSFQYILAYKLRVYYTFFTIFSLSILFTGRMLFLDLWLGIISTKIKYIKIYEQPQI